MQKTAQVQMPFHEPHIFIGFLVSATIVLSSTAAAAESHGHKLGEFVVAGEHHGRPYYRQRDTEGESLTEESTYLRTLSVRGRQYFCVLGPFRLKRVLSNLRGVGPQSLIYENPNSSSKRGDTEPRQKHLLQLC